jgi:hypothetical protein
MTSTSDSEAAPLLVGTAAAARMLSISPRTLWNWTAPRGPIPVVRTPGGRLVLYSVDALRTWIDQATSSPSEGADLR